MSHNETVAKEVGRLLILWPLVQAPFSNSLHGGLAQVAAASGDQPPPAQVPQGLERLASLWTAPLPDYAPPFIRSSVFGYLLSAMVGTGLIILTFLLAGWLMDKIRGRVLTAES